MKNKKNNLLPLLIAVSVLLGGSYFSYTWLSNKPKAYKKHRKTGMLAPLVEVIKPKKIDTSAHIETYGTVIPFRTQTLSSRVSSQIIRLLPDLIPGSIIKKGELLVELDPTDYILALKEKESGLAAIKLLLETEIQNQKSAIFEFSMMENNVSESEKNYLLRYPHIEAAKASVQAQEAACSKAKVDLQRCKIYAPFDAVVLDVMTASGDTVSSSSSLATLARAETFWIRVALSPRMLEGLNIPEYNAKKGSRVSIRHDFWHKDIPSIEGWVQSVEKMVDDNSKMAYVLIEVNDPLFLKKEALLQKPLFLNEFVHLDIQGKVLKDVLKVPSSALRSNDSMWILTKEKTLHIKKVRKLWHEEKAFYIQASSLSEDEYIITTIIEAPVEGMLLRSAQDKKLLKNHKNWQKKETK